MCIRDSSDVKVTTDIDWPGCDNCLTVDYFSAETVGDVSRGMLNAKQQFVIEYHIVGTLRYNEIVEIPQLSGNAEAAPFNGIPGTPQPTNKFRPFIDSVFISDRFDEFENGDRYVDVLVQPRIDLKYDASYTGDSIPFDIRAQRLSLIHI